VAIETYVDNGGFLRIIANTAQTAALEIQIGTQIYVKDFDNKYATAGFVTTVVSGGVPNFIFDTDIPFNGIPVLGGYLNILARASYFVEVTIQGRNPITGVTSTWATARVDTDPAGFGKLNLEGYLNGYVDKVNAYDYYTKNVIDPYVFGSFRLLYTGKWVNGEESFTITDGAIYYFCDNTKKLLDQYGQNLCDYIPFADSTLSIKGKFLCDFNKPTFFRGYPFDLSVIIPEAFGTSVGMTANEERFFANGISDGTQDEAMILYKEETVQRVKVMDNYDPDIAEIDFWLQGDSVPDEEYFEDGYIDDGYFVTIGGSILTPYRVTEKKRIKIVDPCLKNPLYLAWRNTKGGWSYWLFDRYQEHNITTKIDGTFSNEGDYLETSISRDIITDASAAEKIKLFTQISRDDISGFQHFEKSPRILMFISQDLSSEPPPPPVWLEVKAVPKGITYRNDADKLILELEIVLPEHYTIPN